MNIFNKNLIINFDAPSPWGTYFQDSASPQMEGIIELHNFCVKESNSGDTLKL